MKTEEKIEVEAWRDDDSDAEAIAATSSKRKRGGTAAGRSEAEDDDHSGDRFDDRWQRGDETIAKDLPRRTFSEELKSGADNSEEHRRSGEFRSATSRKQEDSKSDSIVYSEDSMVYSEDSMVYGGNFEAAEPEGEAEEAAIKATRERRTSGDGSEQQSSAEPTSAEMRADDEQSAAAATEFLRLSRVNVYPLFIPGTSRAMGRVQTVVDIDEK
jgi:hypothetical protein